MQSWILSLLLSGVVGVAAWYYYTDTQAKLAELTEANATLLSENAELILDLQQANTVAEGLRDAAKFNEQAYRALETRANRAETYQDRLIELYQKHDLTKLAAAKPGLIETRINERTKEVFDDLESITSVD